MILNSIKYIDGTFKDKCNIDMVELEEVKEEDRDTIHHLLYNHLKYTKSKKAKKVIDNIRDELKRFVKVIPIEYKRVLEGAKIEYKVELTEASDG